MSQILKDLNKLAAKMGAPVVGRNISEQVRAISTYYEGTTHGANIAERINEVRHAWHEGSEPATLVEKSIIQNGIYLATDDEADGYSKVTVDVPPNVTTKNITANGNYAASSDQVDGYSSVNVKVKPDYSLTDGFTDLGSAAFSTGKYFNWNNPYEIQICAIKLASVTGDRVSMGPYNGYFGVPKIGITDGYINFVPNAGTSGDIDSIAKVFDTSPMTLNQPIWVRATYDGGAVGEGVVRLLMSDDGENFEEIASKTITTAMRNTTDVVAFGSVNNNSTYTSFPYLSYVWNECYIKINGNYVWGHA